MIQLFFYFALSITQQNFANLPEFNHSLHWQTIETDHFYIHFSPTITGPAYRIAEMAEPIRAKLIQKFRWDPEGKVHVVLSDFSDESNGLSTPVPYNAIYLYVAPPTDDSTLDDYDDWLKMLFTHELTHSVHIDMASGLNSFLRKIFGRMIVPNAAQQQWGLEGLAELQETLETTRGRGRSPFINMYLRTVSLEDKFLSIDRATYWHDHYPLGNAAYFYGIGFYQFLVKKYGEEKVYDFVNATSSTIIPSFFNFKTKEIFGKSFARLWNEWIKESAESWNQFKARVTYESFGESITAPGERIEGYPAWEEASKTLYASIVSKDFKPEIRAFHFDESGKATSEKLTDGIAGRLSLHKGFLYYSKQGFADQFRSSSDVYAFDLKSKKAHRLTQGLRLRDPIVVGNEIIAVRTDAIKSSLVKLPLPENFTDSSWNGKLRDSSVLQTLYSASGFDTISKPSLSPDETQIVFSMREEMKGRHLFLFNLKNKNLRRLTNEKYDDYHPVFLRDGAQILFTSARPLAKDKAKSEILIPNTYLLNLHSAQISPVTQDITGTAWPLATSDRLFFGHYRSEGYELQSKTFKPVLSKSKSSASGFSQVPPRKEIEQKLPTSANLTDYNSADSLLPHYLLPFFFFTESDLAFGAVTGSFDPLLKHTWNAGAWYLSSANRPGGSFNYSYRAFDVLDLSAGISAGITDYGSVMFYRDSSNVLRNFSDHYFERSYYAFLNASTRILTDSGFSGFSIGDSFFFERREPLLAMPSGALSGTGTINSGGVVTPNVVLGPERGHQWGNLFYVSYSSGVHQTPLAESPIAGLKITASLEYTPKLFEGKTFIHSNFETLTSMLTGKSYFEIADGHYLATTGALGLQWLDPLYQRSFQLGGSLGESPFNNVNKRIHPLRGLETGRLRGEGIARASLEYRFSLIRNIPGFGTAPIWFKNLFAAAFTDAGQTFEWKHSKTLIEFFQERAELAPQMQRFGWNRFTQSVGAELQSHISLTYAPPLDFRLGYGQVVFFRGEWVGDQRMGQVYFTAGSSF